MSGFMVKAHVSNEKFFIGTKNAKLLKIAFLLSQLNAFKQMTRSRMDPASFVNSEWQISVLQWKSAESNE